MTQIFNQTVDEILISSLKVNKKGWNIQLFEDQNKISSHTCIECNSVCYDAVELGCDHNEDDIFLYCNYCCTDLVEQNNSKCPINDHMNPIIISSRAWRRQISKAMVFCPYSTAFTSENNELINKNNYQIIDTAGSDEKEGVQLQSHNKNKTNFNTRCKWKGTLTDLINNHIATCAEKYNPTYALTKQIQKLTNENKDLNQQIVALTHDSNLKDQTIGTLNMKNRNLRNKIDELQNEMKLSKQQLTEQSKLMQDLLKNMDNKLQNDEKKNDDVKDIEEQESDGSIKNNITKLFRINYKNLSTLFNKNKKDQLQAIPQNCLELWKKSMEYEINRFAKMSSQATNKPFNNTEKEHYFDTSEAIKWENRIMTDIIPKYYTNNMQQSKCIRWQHRKMILNSVIKYTLQTRRLNWFK